MPLSNKRLVQKVRTERALRTRRWCVYFLWRSVACMCPNPPQFAVVVKRWTGKWKIPLQRKCAWWYSFKVLKTFARWKFTGRLLKCVLKVKWTKGMWGSGICCAKKARQRATACRNARVGGYTRIARTVQVENFRASSLQSGTCAKWSSLVSPPQEMFSTKMYKRYFHDMTSASIYKATVWKSSSM